MSAVACASPTPVNAEPMEVAIDAFSGRPNPTWIASPERAASISRGLSSLTDAPARPEPDHLGYRGFIVRQGGLRARVYDGHVIIITNGTTRTFVDSAGLEAQLIDDARQRGFGDVIRK
ncbi:MAG TPA: hypothetical protein VM115_10375 [Vicinamibacterales bacterium]|nr:hypothetical protein [Vicinamibacterales bacterium]